ncbi:short-chain dehydrogenase [Aaosphaeria arxii CBS 175.79]|uniref:Short-chain dehydrogenase n=1 Tax=Aaosphaeria arxii CBS 175.79 TaxID=1450172 RepID=A0A6A5XG48_9PLEO|nr:short-chain dehydrogenase [Aaosphaeria arxii CBS 175.79]KAF2011826.1 short-chain dehydrogenase [Aaosphaeria arxii CBS 175.79]
MSVFGTFISQPFISLPEPTDSYSGKTVIVTGSNVGLGLEAARHFTRLGASIVILAVRSVSKGEAAKNDIEKSTGIKDVIQVWELDMSSYQSVLNFVALAKELKRLDIALLNAGIQAGKWEVFEQDESTITVNVVSTFLLTLALLPKLKATANQFNTRPNLTIVASAVHFLTQFPEKSAPEGQIFEKLNIKGDSMQERYYVSKLLEVLIVRAIADRRPASQIPVTINCVNPGFCHSELTRNVSTPVYIASVILKALFARTTEQGSRTLVHAASQGPETHGQYMSDCQITPPAPLVLHPVGYVTQNRVWNELTKKLEAIKPGITSNL